MSATVVETERGGKWAASAREALLGACGASMVIDPSRPLPGTGPALVVIESNATLVEPEGIRAAVAAGRRVVVVAGPGAGLMLGGTTITLGARPIETSSPRNPLVADSHLDATVVTGPHAGATLTTRDFAVINGGTPLACTADGHPVAVTFDGEVLPRDPSRTEGWEWSVDRPQTILLYGEACVRAQSGSHEIALEILCG